MKYETILYERKGKIVYITLNRPEILNAVNDTCHGELIEAMREFDADEEAWVAILSGRGRCFTSGADVKQRQLRPREELARLGGPMAGRPASDPLGLCEANHSKPVIAAVHGHVIGIGLMFALACDLIVAAEDSRFQMLEVRRGLGGSSVWVPLWFWGGGKFANEIALTGRTFFADEAYRLGMVNRVVPGAQLMPQAERLAEEILANPPLSVRSNVKVCRWYVRRMIEEIQMYRSALKLYLTEDFRESALAFVEKRKPAFKGR